MPSNADSEGSSRMAAWVVGRADACLSLRRSAGTGQELCCLAVRSLIGAVQSLHMQSTVY